MGLQLPKNMKFYVGFFNTCEPAAIAVHYYFRFGPTNWQGNCVCLNESFWEMGLLFTTKKWVCARSYTVQPKGGYGPIGYMFQRLGSVCIRPKHLMQLARSYVKGLRLKDCYMYMYVVDFGCGCSKMGSGRTVHKTPKEEGKTRVARVF